MIKIPTLFKKQYDENDRYIGVCSTELNVNPDDLPSLVPTIKYDGTACLIHDGVLYKRYDNKKHKEVPQGSIFCDASQPPHEIWWVPCDESNPADKHHVNAFHNLICCDRLCGGEGIADGTYELIGKHFQGNPYNLDNDIFIPHGINRVALPEISYESTYQWCKDNNHEGLVFWKQAEDGSLLAPVAKIRRKDFGLSWK